jgi:hypothetical protein
MLSLFGGVDETSGKAVSMGKVSSSKTVSISGSNRCSQGCSSSVSVVGNGKRGSYGVVMGDGVDGWGKCLLDDWLTSNSNWVGNVIGGINMDCDGHLNDLLLVDGNIIGNLDTSLDIDGLIDSVDLSLGGDNGRVDMVGTTENSWDSDGEMGCRWLDDAGGMTGHIGSLAVVNLLCHDWLRLNNSGDTGSLGLGGVGGGDHGGNSYWGSMGNSYGSSSQGSSSQAEAEAMAQT